MAEKRTIIVRSIDKAWRRLDELDSSSNAEIDESVSWDVAHISKMYSDRWEFPLWTDNHLHEMLERTHARLDELENKYLKGDKE